MDIDVEKLIAEIRKRPLLWDPSFKLYRDKQKRRLGWSHVCRSLYPNFDQENKERKLVIERAVIAKWRTVRDGYVKSNKKAHEGNKSGKTLHRKYVYASLLGFLNDATETRKTIQKNYNLHGDSSSLSGVTNNGEIPNLQLSVDQIVTNYLHKFTQLIDSRVSTVDDDEDMSFFKAMLPSVRNLDQSRKFKFRIHIMDYLQNLLSEVNQSGSHSESNVQSSIADASMTYQHGQTEQIFLDGQRNSASSSPSSNYSTHGLPNPPVHPTEHSSVTNHSTESNASFIEFKVEPLDEL